MVELQLGTKIKAVQSDWGGEFRAFTTLLQQCGIIHRIICPHTHEQNGLIERKHRHIAEMGLTLLANSFMPSRYWDTAFETAVFLINRLPTEVLKGASPIGKLLGIKPDYIALKVFGCACFPLLRPYNSHKMAYRSSECVFMGYSLQHKGYKCLDPQTSRIYISRHVQVNEGYFPFSRLQGNSPVSFSEKTSPGLSAKPPLLAQFGCYDSTNRNNHLTSTAPPCSVFPINPNNTFNSAASGSLAGQTQEMSQSPIGDYQTSAAEREIAPVPNFPVTNPTIPCQSATQGVQLPENKTAPTAQGVRKSSTSHHSMTTRSKSGIFKPKFFLAHSAPASVKEALSDENWKRAMVEEIQSLQKNDTWILVPLPQNRRAIGCKWIFKVKENPDGTVQRYKARLVAKGFNQ